MLGILAHASTCSKAPDSLPRSLLPLLLTSLLLFLCWNLGSCCCVPSGVSEGGVCESVILEGFNSTPAAAWQIGKENKKPAICCMSSASRHVLRWVVRRLEVEGSSCAGLITMGG